jgi:hypothetical protein
MPRWSPYSRRRHFTPHRCGGQFFVATFTIQPLIICSFHILLLSTVSAAIIELADGQDGVGTASVPAHRPRARPLAAPLDPQAFGSETTPPWGALQWSTPGRGSWSMQREVRNICFSLQMITMGICSHLNSGTSRK